MARRSSSESNAETSRFCGLASFAGLIGAGFEGVLSEFVNPTKDPY